MHRLSPQASRRIQREKACLLILNNLLHSLRIPLHMLSLSECPSNLWYTLYLNIVKRPIASIQSPASSLQDRIRNVQRVLDALEKDMHAPQYIAHLDAQAIVLGNKRMLCDLVEIFAELDLALLHPDVLQKSHEAAPSSSATLSQPTTTTFTSSHLSSLPTTVSPIAIPAPKASGGHLLCRLQQEAGKKEEPEPSFLHLSQSTEIEEEETPSLRRMESFLTARSESPAAEETEKGRSRGVSSTSATSSTASPRRQAKRSESPYRQFLEKRMKQYTQESASSTKTTPKKSTKGASPRKQLKVQVPVGQSHRASQRYYLSPTHGLTSSSTGQHRMKMPVPSTKEGILQLLQKVLPGVSVPSHVQRHFAHAVSDTLLAEAVLPSNPYLRQAEQEELRKAKIELNERRRRVVRLTKESMDAQKEAHRRQLIRENLEEKVATDLLTKLLKYSASEQLEMARLEKDAHRVAEEKKRQEVMKERTQAVQWLDLLSEALTSELKKATLSEDQKRSILEAVIADAKASYRQDVKKSRSVLKNDAIHEMTWRRSDAENAWEDVIAA